MISFSTKVEVAPVNVMTSNDGGLSDEQIAQMAVDKIVSVSNNAPDVIRDQANVFKENVKNKNVLKEDQLVKKHTIIEDNVLGGAR